MPKNLDDLDGIGETQIKSVEDFFSNKKNSEIIQNLINSLTIKDYEKKIKSGKLSNKNRLSRALDVLSEQPSIKKDMWIKRAKEYEKSINSGDPVLIAEVVRDLHKKEDSLEQQSYSERQIYLTALNRLSNEYAAVQNLEKKVAKTKLEELLNQ